MLKQYLKSLVVFLLTCEAKLVLKKYHPRIVAITGTVGKTATKDAVATALSAFFSVRKSEKSFNTEIGVPLTILGLQNPWNNPFLWLLALLKGLFLISATSYKLQATSYPQWLVLEVGADKPGDISSLATWLRPDVAVSTSTAEVPVHSEFFPSVSALLKEKSALARSVKDGGLLILGSDDKEVAALSEVVRERRVVCFGTTERAEVRGSHYAVRYGTDGFPEGMLFRVQIGGASLPLSVSNVLGAHQMQPFLAALAVCFSEGLNLVQAAERLSHFLPPRGRMRLLRGINSSLIIDDSYNSSPVALTDALSALGSLEISGRKIAVLGDMRELGEHAAEEHRKGGALAASSCSVLYTVGTLAAGFAEGARGAGMSRENITQCRDSREAGEMTAGLVRQGDVVLIKGSQAVRMERAVKELLAEPARAAELLVRKEREWERR